MLNHDIASLPWQVVGADLFYNTGREFLILVDFYSFIISDKRIEEVDCNIGHKGLFGSLRNARDPSAAL